MATDHLAVDTSFATPVSDTRRTSVTASGVVISTSPMDSNDSGNRRSSRSRRRSSQKRHVRQSKGSSKHLKTLGGRKSSQGHNLNNLLKSRREVNGKLGAVGFDIMTTMIGDFESLDKDTDDQFRQLDKSPEMDAWREKVSINTRLLFFKDVEFEAQFRDNQFSVTGDEKSTSYRMGAWLASTAFTAVALDLAYHLALVGFFTSGVGIGQAATLLVLIAMWWISSRQRFSGSYEGILSFGFLLAGVGVSCAQTLAQYNLDSLQQGTTVVNSSLLLVILVCGHLFDLLLHAFVFLSSWAIVLVHLFLSIGLLDLSTNDAWASVLLQIVWLCLINAALCYGTYTREIYRRKAFVQRDLNQMTAAKMAQEHDQMQTALFEIAMKGVEFDPEEARRRQTRAPVEHIMEMLTELKTIKHMPARAIILATATIDLIGNSTDIFKPSAAQILDSSNELDADTENWLMELLNTKTGGDSPKHVRSVGSSHTSSPTTPTTPTTLTCSKKFQSMSLSSSSPIPSGDHQTYLLQPRSATSSKRNSGRLSLALAKQIGSTSKLNKSAPRSADEQALDAFLIDADEWDFDVFELVQQTNGQPLIFMGIALAKKYDLVNQFDMDQNKFRNFLAAIQNGYQDNPYHNSTHATDVAQTMHFFHHHCALAQPESGMTPLEILSSLISGIIHDFDHPGRSNAFSVSTMDELALVYNDQSVLEMHHISSAFRLLLQEENNFLSSMDRDDFMKLRKLVIEQVLATDLGKHFDFVSTFKAKFRSSHHCYKPDEPDHRLMVLKMVMKAADISHSAKSIAIHQKWTHRITEEFFRQGDLERANQMPVSPLCDRNNHNLPKSQIGFMNFLVLPLYEAWYNFLEQTPVLQHEAVADCVQQLKDNRDHWKALTGDPSSPSPKPIQSPSIEPSPLNSLSANRRSGGSDSPRHKRSSGGSLIIQIRKTKKKKAQTESFSSADLQSDKSSSDGNNPSHTVQVPGTPNRRG